MKYAKPALTYESQAELIISRGLIADKKELVSILKNVNYYRLSAYLYPYRQQNDTYLSGTTLEDVWRHYTFDRQLRLIIIDVIERVEVALRTKLVYIFAHNYGPYGYLDKQNLPCLNSDKYLQWINKLKGETNRSKEIFVKRFFNRYGDFHNDLPLWMLSEIMSFGCTLTFFNGVNNRIRQEIAKEYFIPDKVFINWLGSLNVIRNICAHHGRLWNRILGFKPLIPDAKKYPDWHEPSTIDNSKIFSILSVLKFLLNLIAPNSHWKSRLTDLLDHYPDVDQIEMGFIPDWQENPIWKVDPQ